MDREISCVTVFGGTGFVGHRVARHGVTVRIASRHPIRTGGDNLEQIAANAHDERSVEAAVAGADGVVNAISLYLEHGPDTFHSVHVEAAAKIARSGEASRDQTVCASIRNRRRCELSIAVYSQPGRRRCGRAERIPGAVIIRAAVMFAPDNAFLTTILRLLRSPAYPMFGDQDHGRSIAVLER
jgi:uncharacterized protein YbjT (DUF2867 family)